MTGARASCPLTAYSCPNHWARSRLAEHRSGTILRVGQSAPARGLDAVSGRDARAPAEWSRLRASLKSAFSGEGLGLEFRVYAARWLRTA